MLPYLEELTKQQEQRISIMDKSKTNITSSMDVVSRNSSSNEGTEHQNDKGTAVTLSHQAMSMDDATSLKSKQASTSNSLAKLSICVLVGGILLGLILPKNKNLPSRTWQILSNVIGYTYFLAWSTSFYPQIFLNYERR